MFNKLLGEAKGMFNILTLIFLVLAFIYIIFGLIFVSNSGFSDTAISVVLGGLLICSGIAAIISFFKRDGVALFDFNWLYGIIFIAMGILVFVLGNVLKIALGIYLLVVAIQKINYAILLKKYNESSWLFSLVVGILLVALGVLTFFTSNDNIIFVTGICIIGYGAIDFISILLLRKRSKYFIA